MKLWGRLILAAAIMTGVSLIGLTLIGRAAAQQAAAQQAAKQTAGTFFKNVSTSTLKGLTPDDFLGAMGVMTDSLGLDCADCHPGAGTDKADFVVDTPPKKTARRMVEMVATINRTNFGGAQMVTCYTCHHAREVPSTTIALDSVYSTPNQEHDDVISQTQGQPSATQVLDKYIEALGGAQRLASLTSFVETGTSLGYESLGGNGTFIVYAKAPDQRTTQISFKEHPERGDSTWSFNGRTGWVQVPRGLLGEYELAGTDVDGARLEAQLSFPGQIKQVLNNWRGSTYESIGDLDYLVVEGSGPRGLLAKFYFDPKTGLLARLIRYTPSPVGRIPVQVDYSDYRDVGGIKFPFQLEFLWLDGRYTAKMSDVKMNVAIDEAKFGKP